MKPAKYDGIKSFALTDNLRRLLAEADNLNEAPETNDDLTTHKTGNARFIQVPWTDNKTKAVDQYLKELKKLLGWTTPIGWTAKDIVLRTSSLKVEPGTKAVIIPQNIPGTDGQDVAFRSETGPMVLAKWNVANKSFVLPEGIYITAKENARFYLIVFEDTSGSSKID